MKLFLPALLFFVLGTVTSAAPPGRATCHWLYIPIKYEGMDYERGSGYWRPEVRKLAFLMSRRLKKLILDRKKFMEDISLWHISAPKRMIY